MSLISTGMSFKDQDRPPKGKGLSALANWLRAHPISKKVRRKRTNRTSLSNSPRLSIESLHNVDPPFHHPTVFQLPDEIFVQIFSNLPTYQPENAYYGVDLWDRPTKGLPCFSSVYRTRQRVLLALTQVCRSMRQKFLPWLWEHLQYLPGRSNGTVDYWWAWEALREQSRVLIATPSLAACVRYAYPPPHSSSLSRIPTQTRFFQEHYLCVWRMVKR